MADVMLSSRSAAREDSAKMQPGNASKNRSILHREKWDASKPPVVGAKIVRVVIRSCVCDACFYDFYFFLGAIGFYS